MKRIELFTADGRYVATVEIAPFQLGPDVIMWGSRIFMKRSTHAAPTQFFECCAVATFTPSPGLERPARCLSFVEDGGFIRPCELVHDHGPPCHYEVVTNENSERLRAPVGG